MLSTLKQIFSPPLVKQQAFETYGKIVTQSRREVFYKDWQIEDMLDGRFDVIVLHLFLVISRCEQESSPETQSFIRHLSETFFSDMDRSLREMGASDTGVGIRVKKMAQAFYGRLKAYSDSIGDELALAEALKRNIYREKALDAAALAAYMQRNHAALRQQPLDAIMQGNIVFSS